MPHPDLRSSGMATIDLLLENAYQDTQLLLKNGELGDEFSKTRDVDFVLKTGDRQRAELVCSFMNDNQYGACRVEEGALGELRVVTVVHMPATQHLICSVSGLMVCVGALFNVEYDGWGCIVQSQNR